MNLKRETKNLIKFGWKNGANRRKAIRCALAVVSVLNEAKGKHMSSKQLERITGGTGYQGGLGEDLDQDLFNFKKLMTDGAIFMVLGFAKFFSEVDHLQMNFAPFFFGKKFF